MQMRAEYRRTVHLSEPLSPGLAFETKTHNGYIVITGADVTDCDITAEIVARAITDEDAMELAEETNVVFERGMNKLTAKIVKPLNMFKRSVGVNLTITVPNKTDLELTTHNGRVEITNITGNLDGTIGDHFIDVHVARGAATGLVHVDGELAIVLALGHLSSGSEQMLDLGFGERIFTAARQLA